MEPTVKHLFRLSLVALFAGSGLEIGFMVGEFGTGGCAPLAGAGQFLVLHGFAATALFAFMYHMLPKLMGSFLRSRGLVTCHLLLAAPGLALVATGALGETFGVLAAGSPFIPAGSLLVDAGFLVGAANLLTSFNLKAPLGGPVIKN